MPTAETLIDVLQHQAEQTPDALAYSFYSGDATPERLTFAQLDAQAQAIAARLQQQLEPGARVLLVYPAGLEFIAAFFGCLYAGVLALPATYPKPKRPMPRLESIARDSGAELVLSTAQTIRLLDRSQLSPELAQLRWQASDEAADAPAWRRPTLASSDLAFLQYTSGSTSEPRGVMVSHGNLLHNLEMIRQGFQIEASSSGQTGVFWLPAYHDMGLIGGILEPLYVGGHSVLLAPQTFLQRPLRWLQLISQYGAAVSGAPNFAYDLCVQKTTAAQRAELDLSRWQVAFCGAEPIRPETLEQFASALAPAGFRREAFYPCYGLAEGTLLAAGGTGPGLTVSSFDRAALAERRVAPAVDGRAQRLVACGHALLDQQLLIVEPESRTACPPERVGEIWVAGPSIAQGYWNRPAATAETFAGELADQPGQKFLRTGDLGFVHDGQLYVTGRLKDVIILRGRNYYPQDLENTVSETHPALKLGSGSAFTVSQDDQERLVLVQEVDRQYRELDLLTLARQVRGAVADQHELEVGAVVLVRHASLPRTTSGKIQRALCRERYLADELKVLYAWTAQPASAAPSSAAERAVSWPALDELLPGAGTWEPRDQQRLAEAIERWLLQWLAQRSETPEAEAPADRPFFEYGLDSLAAVELSQELEDWLDLKLTPVVAWNYPTPTALSGFLAEQVIAAQQGALPDEADGEANDDQLAQLLEEIETLSDDEAEAALRRARDGQ